VKLDWLLVSTTVTNSAVLFVTVQPRLKKQQSSKDRDQHLDHHDNGHMEIIVTRASQLEDLLEISF